MSEYKLHYVIQGNHVYSRVETTEPDTGEPSVWEGAYNGTDYQELENGLLEVSQEPPRPFVGRYHGIQPIVVPFGFVFTGDDAIQFSTLLNEGMWRRLAADSSYVGTARLGDRLCDVVLVEKRNAKFNADFTYRVFLDRELDYYPIRWELDVTPLPDADGPAAEPARTEGTVQTLTRETSSGPVVIPVEVRVAIFDADDELAQTSEMRIDPETLRVNKPIDAVVFTMDESRAFSGILDGETGNITMPNERRIWQTGSFYLWMALVVFLFGVVIFLLRRRWQ